MTRAARHLLSEVADLLLFSQAQNDRYLLASGNVRKILKYAVKTGRTLDTFEYLNQFAQNLRPSRLSLPHLEQRIFYRLAVRHFWKWHRL